MSQNSFYQQLAQLPTPIHSWPVPGLPDTFSLHIKRDDLTGSTLSGNKVMSVLLQSIELDSFKRFVS